MKLTNNQTSDIMQRRVIAYEQYRRQKFAASDNFMDDPTGSVICERDAGVAVVNLPDEFTAEDAEIAVLQVADVDYVDRVLDLGQTDDDVVEAEVFVKTPA